MGQSKGRVARFTGLSVRTESKTLELATELAKLMTAKHGHRVSRPDAVHEAIRASVNQLKTEMKQGARLVGGQAVGV